MIKEFEKFTIDNWKQPELTPERATLCYMATCMTGEAGETADAVKKYCKSTNTKEDILLEMGDTLHYLTRLGLELGYSLDDIMIANLDKLRKRKSVY